MRSDPLAPLDAIAHYAQSTPQAPALIVPDGPTLNYRELWAQIEAISGRLAEAGVAEGQRVAILLPQGALQVLTVAGVLNRHSAIPLQSKTTPAEVESTLRNLHASTLIVSLDLEAEAAAAAKMGLTVLVARDGEPPGKWPILAAVSPRNFPVASSDAILILVTSATTGSSKLVPLTAANLNAGTASTRDAAQLTSSDRLLLLVSLCHRNGVENAFAQFLVGGTVIATEGFEPAGYIHWLNDLRPTWYLCSPTVHQAALVQLRSQIPTSPVSLRFVQSSGAPLPADARQELEQILRIPVLNAYGATEAHHIAIELPPPAPRVPNAAGRSCGSEIGIMRPSGTLLPAGEEGEIAVRGPAVFSGYIDNPEGNLAAFHDGWFRTGDLGRLDASGNLFVTGRLKEMINRGGEKIVPEEVDAVLAVHPSVLEVAAFAIPHPTLGEDVACAIVLNPETQSPVTIAELRRFAAQRLARFKLPSRVFFVAEIPRGELGKPQRWLLRERFSKERALPPSPALVTKKQSDGLFFTVYEIWTRMLERDDLGFDENFFEAGGDSLAAINMLAEVDTRLGSNTGAFAFRFLDEPTIATVVELIGTKIAPSQELTKEIQVFPVRNVGAPLQLFCVSANGEEGLYFRRLAARLEGLIDLSIVRPANTWHSQSFLTFEQAGATTAMRIREAQPEGPYFIGGYCYGGIVAIEAARCLMHQGHKVRLTLFDVLMPGFPPLLQGRREWFESLRSDWRNLRHVDHQRLVMAIRCVASPMVWFALRPFRGVLVPFERFGVVRQFLNRMQTAYFPFYRARLIDVPILHFLSTDAPNPVDSAARTGWRTVAPRGVSEQWLPYDHANLFHESNLPRMVDVLLRWLDPSRTDL